MGTLVAKLLLPTLSTLALLPTISVAAKRRFHMEAMVYLFTMFFLAFHHACAGPGLSVLCFLRHDILEYFSVYGTALSMWVSLMALADFDEPQRSTLVMLGVLTIAVRTYHDRQGYGVYSGPVGTAVLLIAAKWLLKMKEKRGLYPDRSVYTQQVGPGLCFGALALMLRFFFQEWDYTYVHSFYHCALAMAFVLLLPKVNKKAGDAGAPAKLDFSTLCCAWDRGLQDRPAGLGSGQTLRAVRVTNSEKQPVPTAAEASRGPVRTQGRKRTTSSRWRTGSCRLAPAPLLALPGLAPVIWGLWRLRPRKEALVPS